MNNEDLKESYGLDTETDFDFNKIVDKIENRNSILKGLHSKARLFKDNNKCYRERWIFCSIEKIASLYDCYDNFVILKIINNIVNQLLILYDIDTPYCLKNCRRLTERICEELLSISTKYFEKIYYEKYEYITYDKKNEIGINNMMKKILKKIQLGNIILKDETENLISKCYYLYNLKKKDMIELIKDWEYRKDLYNNHFNLYDNN